MYIVILTCCYYKQVTGRPKNRRSPLKLIASSLLACLAMFLLLQHLCCQRMCLLGLGSLTVGSATEAAGRAERHYSRLCRLQNLPFATETTPGCVPDKGR